MLKKYILLLMVLSFGYGYLVEDVIERYENGYLKKVNYYERILINGYENQILVTEREFYDNGYIKYEKNYKEGELHGKFIEYYKDGQIHYEGKEDGVYLEYNRNGQLVYEKYYEGEDSQLYERYLNYSKNGLINNVEIYRDEGLSSVLVSELIYDQWGQLFLKVIRVEDDEKVFFSSITYDLNGTYEQYYKNGKIWFEVNYKNSIVDGSYVEYFENGQIAIKGQYCEGSQFGVWTYYDFLEDGGMTSGDTNYGTCEDVKAPWDDDDDW